MGFLQDIHFISRYIVLVATLLVSGKQTHPRQFRAETQINREASPTKALARKGPPCHKSSSKSAKTKLEGNGWVETMNDETNTRKPKYGGNDYLYSS